jgi:hypothetical protein
MLLAEAYLKNVAPKFDEINLKTPLYNAPI